MLARGLERLPPVYSEVLREHFYAGRAPGEIAERLGRPPGTVRAQLHRGLRLLRGMLPFGLAGWLAWLGPSRAGLLRMRRAVLEAGERAADSVGRRAGSPPLVGARVVGAGALVLAGWVGLRLGVADSPIAATPTTSGAAPVERVAVAPLAEPANSGRDIGEAPAEEASVPAGTHGSLLVRVTFSDGTPAADVGLRIYAWGNPSWAENLSYGVTDASGEFEIPSIRAGRVGLYCDRNGDQGSSATVAADERALKEIVLPLGVQLEGEVVDARGAPVPGAGVWLSEAPTPRGGRIAVACDEHGRFALRDVSPRRYLGARAPGYAPSEVEWLASGGVREGERATLRLVLRDAGGSVRGRVLGPEGAPLAGTEVLVRAPSPRAARLRADGILLGPPSTFEARTDEQGRFAFEDLALGEFQLVVRAPGLAQHVEPLSLTLEAPHAEVEPRLVPGGTVRGRVRFDDGSPASGAVVIVNGGVDEQHDGPVQEDGTFVFEHVAPGTLRLQAGFGHFAGGPLASGVRELEPGGEVQWEGVLERPLDYAGRLLGPDGLPLAGAWIRGVASADVAERLERDAESLALWLHGWSDRRLRRSLDQVATDAQGRFTLRGQRPGFALEVRPADGRTGWPVWVLDPPPADGEIALPATAMHTASLSGTLAAPDGGPLARGEVYAVLREGGEMRGHLDGEGAFRIGALPAGTYDLLVWSRGHRPQVVAELDLAEDEQRDLGWLRLAP